MAWCAPCQRSFPHERALQQHLNSSRKHMYPSSSSDEPLYESSEYESTEYEQWICDTCSKSFKSQNELEYHKIVHFPENISCWGCQDRFFKHPSYLFLHLEGGRCDWAGNGEDIADVVDKIGGPWKNRDYDSCDGWPIRCPDCDAVFMRVSAFLQHIESNRCNEGYFSGRRCAWGLLRQLRRSLHFQPQQILGQNV